MEPEYQPKWKMFVEFANDFELHPILVRNRYRQLLSPAQKKFFYVMETVQPIGQEDPFELMAQEMGYTLFVTKLTYAKVSKLLSDPEKDVECCLPELPSEAYHLHWDGEELNDVE